MKTRSTRASKTRTMGDSQSGSGLSNEPIEVVIDHILVGNDKEVTISQIGDPSSLDNEEDRLEESTHSSMYDDKLSKEKRADAIAAEPRALNKGNEDPRPIIINRPEAVEQQPGREILYHKTQRLAPERGRGGYIYKGGCARSCSSNSFEGWIPSRESNSDKLRKEVFMMMNEHFDTLRAKVEALIKGKQPWRPKGRHTWSNDDMEDDMSSPQRKEHHKRHEPPLNDKHQKRNTCSRETHPMAG